MEGKIIASELLESHRKVYNDLGLAVKASLVTLDYLDKCRETAMEHFGVLDPGMRLYENLQSVRYGIESIKT